MSGPGSLLKGGNGTVVVTIQGSITASSGVAALTDAGARVINVSRRYSTVTAAVAPVDLSHVATVSGVRVVTEVLAPTLAAMAPATARAAGTTSSSCAPVTSEASTQLKAAIARSTYGVSGAGVTVGILSDSFARTSTPTSLADDIASGNLPGAGNPCGYTTPVNILDDTEAVTSSQTPSDEGRGMAQLVHHVAPAAALQFATAYTGEFEFADNIRSLAAHGSTVIVDDIGYFDEPMYQDGPVAEAINEVTAAGVTYLTATGNENIFATGTSNSVGSLESPTYSGTACPSAVTTYYASITPAVPAPTDCANFNTGAADPTAGYTVPAGASVTVDLQYQQPWYGVTADYDLFVTRGSQVLAVGGDDNVSSHVHGSSTPFEEATWTNTGGSTASINVVVVRYNNVAPVGFKYILLADFDTTTAEYATTNSEHTVGPSVYGHAGASSAISVAAVPYNENTTPEVFSSRGPVTHYFGPVLNTTAASPVTPIAIAKPDVAATDADCTTFFGSSTGSGASCPYRFSGTSAAAPNAAGVIALLKDANPALDVATQRSLLTDNAAAMAGGNADSVGSGLVDAQASIGATDRRPGVQAAPTLTAGQGTLQVSFSAPSVAGNPAILSYTTTCTSASGVTGTNIGATSPITVSGLSGGAAYACTVFATNAVGDGVASPASSSATPSEVPSVPSAPQLIKLKRDKRHHRITGTIVRTNMHGLPALQYRIVCLKVSGRGVSRAALGGKVRVTVGRLRDSAHFRCYAQVRNAAGWSPASASIRR